MFNLPSVDDRALASLGKSSEFISHGRGPKPKPKLAMNTIVAVTGRKASFSKVFSENTVSNILKASYNIQVILPDSVSFRTKYIPRAIIESPIRISEKINRIFLPNLQHIFYKTAHTASLSPVHKKE